jgi:hypothetical protein
MLIYSDPASIKSRRFLVLAKELSLIEWSFTTDLKVVSKVVSKATLKHKVMTFLLL